MTFTYAVIADGGIVLAADSQVTHTHRDQFGNVIGTYEGLRGKIRRIAGRFAFSICGNGGFVDSLLAEVDEGKLQTSTSFEQAVQTYQATFQEYLRTKYPDSEQRSRAQHFGVAFLFCVFIAPTGAPIPQVIKLDIANDFVWNPVTGRDHAFTGSERHGAALYLHNRFYREGMPLEQAKLLAYCAAAEVADLDNSVGGPIEMELITANGTRALSNAEIDQCANGRREMIRSVESFVAAFR